MFGFIFVATVIGCIIGIKIAGFHSYEKEWKKFNERYGFDNNGVQD